MKSNIADTLLHDQLLRLPNQIRTRSDGGKSEPGGLARRPVRKQQAQKLITRGSSVFAMLAIQISTNDHRQLLPIQLLAQISMKASLLNLT